MSYQLIDGRFRAESDAGDPLSGGRLYTYAAGTSTQKTAYVDDARTTPCTYISDGVGGLYIALNARGEASVFLGDGGYTIALYTPAGVTPIWTQTYGADPLADTTDAARGAGAIGYNYLLAYAAGTVGSKLRELISLRDFGAKCDGVTDDTAAVSAAVTFMNVAGQPVLHNGGQCLITNTSPIVITAGGFVGVSEYYSKFLRTDTNGVFFTLGNDALAQFAVFGVTFDKIGLKCSAGTVSGKLPAIQIKNATQVKLTNMFFEEVGKAVWINGTNSSADVYLTDVRIAQSLVNEDCIQISNAASVTLTRVKGYVHAANAFPPLATPIQTAGGFIAIRAAAGAHIDTIRMVDCEGLYFYAGLPMPATLGSSYIVNVWIMNCIFDSMVATNLDAAVDITSTIRNIHIGAGSWFTSWNGYGVRFACTGYATGIQFVGAHITQTGVDGMIFVGNDVNVTICATTVDDINRTNAGNASAILAGTEGFSVSGGCRLGAQAQVGFMAAQYAVTITADLARYSVTGNDLRGLLAGVNVLAPHSAGSVDRLCYPNVGDSVNTRVIAGWTPPATNVTYVNKTGYIQEIHAYGGTITGITKNATPILGMLSGAVRLLPGELYTIAYTGSPNFEAFQVN